MESAKHTSQAVQRTGWMRRLLASEAVIALTLAKLALRCLPVRWILRVVDQPQADHTRDAAVTIREVRWAIHAATRHAPMQFVCFPQCLAAYWMLRRRGVASTLHYGVTRDGGKLQTHTWLQQGDTVIVGGEVAPAFSWLASYSSEGH